MSIPSSSNPSSLRIIDPPSVGAAASSSSHTSSSSQSSTSSEPTPIPLTSRKIKKTRSKFFGRKEQSRITSSPPIISMAIQPIWTDLFDQLRIKELTTIPKFIFEIDPNIQFINAELFEEIKVPAIQLEHCISKCFEDPRAMFGEKELFPGTINESFIALQKESLDKIDPRFIGAAYANTYPRNHSICQINCDAYWVGFFPYSKCSLSIVADGCGLSIESRDAAQIVVYALRAHILQNSQREQNLQELIQVILNASKEAHRELISGASKPRITTFTVNFAFTTPSGERYLLVIGLGDTKCFLSYQTDTGKPVTLDLSQNMRGDADLTDSGGALGGFYPDFERKYVMPKLDNLFVTCVRLPSDRNFYAFNLSDGVYDNLNPESLGYSPAEANNLVAELLPEISWEELRPDLRIKLIAKFQIEQFSNLLVKFSFFERENLEEVCDLFVQHCWGVTSQTRFLMEEQPKAMQPKTSKEFPGKIDHTTIAAVAIKAFIPL